MAMVSLQISSVILLVPTWIYMFFGLPRVADAFYVNVYMNSYVATLAGGAVICAAFAITYGIVRLALWDMTRGLPR